MRIGKDIVLFEQQGVMVVRADNLQQEAALAGLATAPPTNNLYTIPWTDENVRQLHEWHVDQAHKALPFWFTQYPLIEGRYTPMPHQVVTAGFMVLHPRAYVLSDCRLGKTGSAIIALNYLQLTKAIRGGILVVTTVTTMNSVWRPAIMDTARADVTVVHGKGLMSIKESHDWYITNYDSIRLHQDMFEKAIVEGRIACILVDELTHVGNVSSKRSRAIAALCNRPELRFVYGMTGSPGSNPEPIYGMAKAITPKTLGGVSKTVWMDMTTYQWGPQPYMRKPRNDAGFFIHKTLQPAIRFRKENVLNLPPVVYQERDCALSGQQLKAIEELREKALTLLDSGEVITAANAAILVSKLLQVPLGFSISEDKKTIDYTTGDRDDVIIDIIQETPYKVVIFNMFRARLAKLHALLTAKKIAAAVIDGSVKAKERAQILSAFSNTESPKVLICHPTTVGYGTELAAADTLILDGPPLLGDFSYVQMVERLSSPKQQASQISIIQVAGTSEERQFFKKLATGHTQGQAVAALFEEYRNGNSTCSS